VDTLCEMLTYGDGSPHYCVPKPLGEGNPHATRYAPPSEVDEFILDRVSLDHEGHEATLPAMDGLTIVIVVTGMAAVEQLDDCTEDAVGLRHPVSMGKVHLVCPHTVLRMKAVQTPVLLFRAAAKPLGFDDELAELPMLDALTLA